MSSFRFSTLPVWACAVVFAAPANAQIQVSTPFENTSQLLLMNFASQTQKAQNWWPRALQMRLDKAKNNRPQVLAALRNVPISQRASLQFLLQNMPERDLQTLSARFLLDHIALIHQGIARAPWKNQIPRPVFQNDVLPYASLNEKRDDSFKALASKARDLTKDAKTPTQAAMRLNEKLFPLVNVKYSTGRKRADQTPLESMESGLASCSGLSILLVDACRTVGVPARVVGTPLWANGRGNHTWVEIWDNGWHFLGAAEPDSAGLNRGWFVHDASQAKRDVPQNAIYASSFRRGDSHFPLVWAPELRWVNAVNVTDRYAKVPEKKKTTRVLLQVLAPDGKRASVPIEVRKVGADAIIFSGQSKDESADLNDFLNVELEPEQTYQLKIGAGDKAYTRDIKVETGAEQLVRLGTNPLPPLWTMQPTYVPPVVTKSLSVSSNDNLPRPSIFVALRRALDTYFASSPEQQKTAQFAAAFNQLLLENEPGVRQLAWEAYKAAPIHATQKADFEAKQVRFEKHLSPYLVRQVGTKPANGWGLVIAMHGGGGTAKEVNDSQWQGMFKHYRDHPENGGYWYIALRAPNDTWNGFYDDYVYPLVGNLIQQYTLFGDVNPNKVMLMGYSHGGYGAFAIGPKTPDRFAAIHASAGAPTDGETTALTLRNTMFTSMVGEFDLAYDRLSRNQKWDAEIKALRGNRTDIYPVRADIMAGFQHGNLKDNDIIAELSHATRNPVPRELTWLQTDGVVRDFFWLRSDNPAKTKRIDATIRDNKLVVATQNNPPVSVMLDSRLMDFSRPLQIEVNGVKSQKTIKPDLRVLCEGLARRGDPELAFTAQIELVK